jgi:hypothetical protein
MGRTLVNNVKAVFVLVAFRCFPQFSDNQREGNHFCNEKPCSYDHDWASSMICARIRHFVTYFISLNLFRAFRFGEFTRGMPAQTNARAGVGNSFPQIVPRSVLPSQPVGFRTVLSKS